MLLMLNFNFGYLVSKFCTNLGLNCLFVIVTVPIFSVGRIIYRLGNFGQWAGLIY